MYYEHYTFGGWYDNENYEGEPLTTYKGTENIDLYAKWIGEEVTVTINDDDANALVYHYGDTFIFPDLPETYVIDAGNVVFDFNDGVTPNSTQHLFVTIYPKYWFYQGYDENGDQHYAGANPGETVQLYGNSYIYAESDEDEDYVFSGVTIPEVPGMEHYSFDGWYNEWDNEITDIEQLEGYDQVIMARYTGEDVIVHLPDEDVTVEYGKVYDIFENNYPTADTIEATVTFKYHAENADDYQAYVTKQYTPSGWLINGVHYNSDTIVFTEETTLVPDYSETVIPAEFPEEPTWFRHDFDGWFTEETGGEQVTSYSDLADITLHAHWHDHMAVITTPDGDVTVDENKQFTFPTNDIAKANQNIGKVTFDPQNGESLIQQNIIKSFTPNGWLLDGVHYDDNETITVLDDSTITPDYIETINVEFPTDPVKPHYTFKGWYSAMNGGDKVLSNDMKASMTVYAHYYETNTEGEEYILPSNQPVKPTETLATVTFDPHNGDPVTTSTVTKKYMAKGWLVDGVQYYNGDIIYKTPETVIEPNYTYTIIPAEFPTAPTRGTERYTGWFTQETGGEQVKLYDGTSDITLHAHYTDNYAILKDGATINRLYCPSGGYCNSYVVMSFDEGTYEQYQEHASSAQVISIDDSPYPVYFWNVGSYYYYYTEADTIYFNEDSSNFFANYFDHARTINIDKFNSAYVTNFNRFFAHTGSAYMTTLPIDKLDTSNATIMTSMFYYTGITSIDFSNFNTSKVVDFNGFLSNCNKLTTLDLSHLDTSKATNIGNMFSSIGVSSLDLSHFDTSNVQYMHGLFFGCQNITTLDLSNFDTHNVTDMGGFISYTKKLSSINLSSFDTSNVTSLSQFMKRAEDIREIDFSSFDTSNVTSIYEMFNECPKLEKVWVSEDKWDNSKLTSGEGGTRTFYEVPKLIGQRGTAYAISTSYHAYANQNGTYAYNRVDKAPEKPGYFWSKYATKYTVTLPDDTEEIYEGAPYTIPTNTYPVDVEVLNTITFDSLNGEETVTSSTIKTKLPAGFKIDDVSYAPGDTYTVNSDITLVPDYTEEIVYATFPDDPVKANSEFAGWYTTETAGDKVEDLTTITEDKTLYARYETTLPTDFTIDTDNVLLAVSDTHVIEVTFDPIETSDNITYTGYDDEIINVTDTGVITGLSKGTTQITVSLENVDVTKTITVTVISSVLESSVYEVRSKENNPKIIIGANPETTIAEFKDNLDNPIEYIKIYDLDDNLLSDDDIVKTGLIIKLEFNGLVLDYATMVVRGDVDGDGYVNISDYIMVANHALGTEEMDDYVMITAGDVEEDEILNIADYIKIMDYALGNSDNLNN